MPEDNIAYSHMMGTLLGCALGDAIGLYTEFLPKATCAEYYGSNPVFTLQYPPPAGTTPLHDDYHRARFVRGSWTDDTDQAILILLSFLRNKAPSGEHQLDARDFAKRIRFWMDSGLRPLDRLPLGIGKTVGSVVTNKRFLDDPFATATK